MKAFASALTAAAVAYGIPIAPQRIEVYEQILGHYGEAALVTAIKTYLTLPTSRFFPVPADLIAVLEGDVGDDEAAGEVVFGRIARVGSDSHAVATITAADHAAAVALQALGGWYAFANSDEAPKYQRRTFARAYAIAARRQRIGVPMDGRPCLPTAPDDPQLTDGLAENAPARAHDSRPGVTERDGGQA